MVFLVVLFPLFSLLTLQDIDFIPSVGLHQSLIQQCQAEENKAYIVPAFELLIENMEMPSNKDQLQAMYFDKLVSGFHTAHFPKGHMPTG